MSFLLIVLIGREESMTGREFQSLGNLKKYELRVVTLLEYLWWSLIPDDLVAEVRKDVSIGSVMLKPLQGDWIDLTKNKMSDSS